MQNTFIDVILPLALPYTFTYAVHASDFEDISIGCRVVVPFGKKNVYTAIVVQKHHLKPQHYEVKEIQEIIDQTPIITTQQLELWKFVANYYMCSLGEVYATALPSSFILKGETIIFLNQETQIDLGKLNDDEYLVYEALEKQPILRIEEIQQILNKKQIFPIIEAMATKGFIRLEEEVKKKYQPKLKKFVQIAEQFSKPDGLPLALELVQRSEKQKRLLLSFFQLKAKREPSISVQQLIEKAEVSKAVYKAVLEKGILEEYEEEIARVNFSKATSSIPELSKIQKNALADIKNAFENKSVVLFKGVTGSGKTEVFINLIQSYLKEEKQILFLVPEIGLTTQLVHRLVKIFGNEVLVYHSKYSLNERHEVYLRMLKQPKQSKIIIGTRSSIFLPFSNLGLVIVDEEHEPSYKQRESAPRFHARDTAIVLAQQSGAKVLLGSATPSLESAYNAYQHKYATVTLSERYLGVPLPDIIPIDLKDAHKRKEMIGNFSHTLVEAIKKALNDKKQCIIFQNRRGFSPILECLDCGFVPKCTSCDVGLTYHKRLNQLKCHYCGYCIAVPAHCYECKSKNITTKGIGTEQIEEELIKLFPEARIARMDKDTTKRKYAFEDLLYQFGNREIDILVGTQMVAKGLDFDGVDVVGIINADSGLYIPDFRAHERTYQLLVQVAGRAGRTHKGTVYLQTYNPNLPIIKQIIAYDYKGMFKQQMYERYNYHYPPFYRIIQLQLKHSNYEKLLLGSQWLVNQFYTELSAIVLGPEEPSINRIKNQFLRNILIKVPVEQSVKETKNKMLKVLDSFDSIAAYRSIKVHIHVDYY